MQSSSSLSTLPLRFQKLLSIVSLTYIAMYISMLIVQQAFYARSGYGGVPFETDLTMMLATIASVVIPFIVGYAMVRRGELWHRLAAGSVVLSLSIVIGVLCDLGTRAASSFGLVTPLFVMAGIPVLTTALTFGAVLAVAARRRWWVQRTKLFVVAALGAIMLVLGQLAYNALQSSDIIAFAIMLGFPVLGAIIAYRAIRGTTAIERVFRVLLVLAIVGMTWVIGSFLLTAITQSMTSVSQDAISAQELALTVLPWLNIGLIAAAYVVSIWFARPKRVVAKIV